jgi:hypothetical protein
MPLRLRLRPMKPGRPKSKDRQRLPNGRIDPLGAARQRAFRPRKRRLLPILTFQPELKELYLEVFSPWLQEYNVHANLTDFFKVFFCEDYRRIREYKVEDSGLIGKDIPLKDSTKLSWSPDQDPRILQPGEVVLLRTDIRQPHIFEVQVLRDMYLDNEDRRVFIMGPREFYDIRKKLSLVDSCD